MALLGNPANKTGVDGALPREADGYGSTFPFSRERLNQTRAVLSRGLNAALGKGMLSAGVVVATGGLAVKMPAGETFFLGGVAYTLDTDLTKNILANGTDTIWATLKRIQAVQSGRANLDTYLPDMAVTLDGNPPPSDPAAPADSWWPVATVTVTSGTPGPLNNSPAGKYAAALAPLYPVPEQVQAGTVAAVPQGTQRQIFRRFTVHGAGARLQVRGHFRIRG